MEYDRISQLPDSLLTQILLNLPTKDSIKTGVLSTIWRNLWLNVHVLDLKIMEFSLNGEAFGNFMDRFMEFSLASRIQKLKIKHDHYSRDDGSEYSNRFKEMIATAIDRGIQHLDVEAMKIGYPIYSLPMNIYKSKTLVSLKLVHVGLNNRDIVVLPCLKIMHLENICYGNYGSLNLEKLISGCSVLEDLTMVRLDYRDLHTLHLVRVRSQTLKVFRLVFEWVKISTKYSVEIDAPRLKYMCFGDSQSDRIMVKNLSSLLKIDLDTEFNVKYGGSPLDIDDARKRDMILGFLTGISSVKHMIISQPTMKVIHRYSKLGPIPNFDNLSHLQAAFTSSTLQLLPIFLERCPNMRNLIMDYSVSTDAEDIFLTNVPQCLTSTLECVTINKLIVWESIGIELVQYFLDHSAVLKKLNLRFTYSSMTNQQLENFKTIILTSRKSSSLTDVKFSFFDTGMSVNT